MNLKNKSIKSFVKLSSYFIFIFTILFINCTKDEFNKKPKIVKYEIIPLIPLVNEKVTIKLDTYDPDGNPLKYNWVSDHGKFVSSTNKNVIQWIYPDTSGSFKITVAVSDGRNVIRKDIPIKVFNSYSNVGLMWKIKLHSSLVYVIYLFILLYISPFFFFFPYPFEEEKNQKQYYYEIYIKPLILISFSYFHFMLWGIDYNWYTYSYIIFSLLFYSPNLGVSVNSAIKYYSKWKRLDRLMIKTINNISKVSEKKNLEKIRNIITSKRTKKLENNIGESLLHYAIRKKISSQVISVMVKGGADVNSINKNGISIISLAVQKEANEIISILLNSGVKKSEFIMIKEKFEKEKKENERKMQEEKKVEEEIQKNTKILHEAIERRENPEKIKNILKKSAGRIDLDYKDPDFYDRTALHKIVYEYASVHWPDKIVEPIVLLLKAGADPTIRDRRGSNVLRAAMYPGAHKAFRKILHHMFHNYGYLYCLRILEEKGHDNKSIKELNPYSIHRLNDMHFND